MLYSTFLSVAIVVLQFSPTTLCYVIPSSSSLESRASDADLVPFPFDVAGAPYIEDAFNTIVSIPDSVLDEGDEAVKQWVNAHSNSPQPTRRDNDNMLIPRQGWFQVLKCALAIGKAVAENAFPVSKLRRIKELVELLGGAKKVAKMLLKAKSIRELLIIGGPELQEIAEILLGVTDVVSACFHF